MEDTKKTRSMSFRLPEEIAESLETEATVKGLSTSTILTQVCRHHFGYEGNTGKAGLVAIPKSLLTRLMDGYADDKIISMADYVSRDVMTDIMAVLENEYTVETFLHTIESWAKASRMPFRRETKGQLNTCIIQHDLGRNWSLYLGTLMKIVIEEIAQKRASITISNNSVRIMF